MLGSESAIEGAAADAKGARMALLDMVVSNAIVVLERASDHENDDRFDVAMVL